MAKSSNGYLYAVAFTGGEVKIGVAETEFALGQRIAAHKLSGRAFGLPPVFDHAVEINTDDLRLREQALMVRCERAAMRRPGMERSEWYKFEPHQDIAAFLTDAMNAVCTEEGVADGQRWSRSPGVVAAFAIMLRTGKKAAVVARELGINCQNIYQSPNYPEIRRQARLVAESSAWLGEDD